MNGTIPTTEDFEFDCPQFTDFSAVTAKQNNDISEEFCQKYFDKKRDEIKRNSAEFNKENMQMDMEIDAIQGENNDTNDTNDTNHENDENDNNTRIPNLLSATEFAMNTSSISSKSSSSYHSHKSHNISNNNNNKSTNAKHLTTEQIQLNAIEQKKIEFCKLKQENAKRVAKMREDHYVFQPTRSTKLTIPITPALHTQQRAKQRLKHRENNQNNNMNHKINKKKKEWDNHKTLKPTIPQSFKLSKRKKRRNETEILSTEQKQLKEIEKYGNFQARKINPKIFKSNASNLGILNNIKNKTSTTTVQPFQLMTEKRAKKYKTNENQK